MREISISTRHHTRVVCVDEPGAGGACHEYRVTPANQESPFYAIVYFQDGPIQEAGVNGCFNEDLIAIVIDRLQGFQSGEFKCRENALAITKLEEALHWLQHRIDERIKRGVEGKLIP